MSCELSGTSLVRPTELTPEMSCFFFLTFFTFSAWPCSVWATTAGASAWPCPLSAAGALVVGVAVRVGVAVAMLVVVRASLGGADLFVVVLALILVKGSRHALEREGVDADDLIQVDARVACLDLLGE